MKNKRLIFLLISICVSFPLIFITVRKLISLKKVNSSNEDFSDVKAIDNFQNKINTEIKVIKDTAENEVKNVLSSQDNVKIDTELTDDQKKLIFKLTSLFENGTTDLQYSYIENLHDGRGYTGGIGGFTSADGEIYDLVMLYTQKKPINPLVKYIPALKKVKSDGSDNTSKLKDFSKAWKKASEGNTFKHSQDELVDKLYFEPAMKLAKENGIVTVLGKAFIYDTMIQHGDGDDPDSLPSIIKKTNEDMKGSPKDGVDEKEWLAKMIEIRKNILLNATDPETRTVWKESAGRCDVFTQIAESGNYDLTTPIKIKTDEYDETIN